MTQKITLSETQRDSLGQSPINYYAAPGINEKIRKQKKIEITIDIIFEAVHLVTGVDREKIISKGRLVSDQRHIFCYLCRFYVQTSYKNIGLVINRDHSTIINSCRVASDLMESNDNFNNAFISCINYIQGSYLNGASVQSYALPVVVTPTKKLYQKENRVLPKQKNVRQIKLDQVKAKRNYRDIPRMHIPEKEPVTYVRHKGVYSNVRAEY